MVPQMSQFVRQNAWLLIVLALIVGGYFLLLYTSPSDTAAMEALEARLRRGQPTLIEFYSSF